MGGEGCVYVTSRGVPFQSQWNVRTVYISVSSRKHLRGKVLEISTSITDVEQWLCVFGLRVLCVTLDGSPRILLCYAYVKGGDSGHGQGVTM